MTSQHGRAGSKMVCRIAYVILNRKTNRKDLCGADECVRKSGTVAGTTGGDTCGHFCSFMLLLIVWITSNEYNFIL